MFRWVFHNCQIFCTTLYLLHIFAPKNYVRGNIFWIVTTELYWQHVLKCRRGKLKVGCSQKNVSTTSVLSRNIQNFYMIDWGMSNMEDTSTGMTFKLPHLFFLKNFIIQTIFPCICTWKILNLSQEWFISRFNFSQTHPALYRSPPTFRALSSVLISLKICVVCLSNTDFKASILDISMTHEGIPVAYGV